MMQKTVFSTAMVTFIGFANAAPQGAQPPYNDGGCSLDMTRSQGSSVGDYKCTFDMRDLSQASIGYVEKDCPQGAQIAAPSLLQDILYVTTIGDNVVTFNLGAQAWNSNTQMANGNAGCITPSWSTVEKEVCL